MQLRAFIKRMRVITTSDFTSQAKNLARKVGVKLGSRRVLSEIIHKAYGSGNFNRKKVSYKASTAATNPYLLKAFKKTIKNFSQSTKKIKSDIKKISRTSRKTKRTFRKINKLFK